MAVKALMKATIYISIRSGIQYHPKYVVSMDRCACYRNINMKLAALLNAIVVVSVLISWLAIIDMVWYNDHPQVIITNAHQRNCILIRGTGVWCYVKNRTILVHNLSTWKICGWELRWPVCNLFSLSFSFVVEDSLDINYTWTNLRWVHLKQVSI